MFKGRICEALWNGRGLPLVHIGMELLLRGPPKMGEGPFIKHVEQGIYKLVQRLFVVVLCFIIFLPQCHLQVLKLFVLEDLKGMAKDVKTFLVCHPELDEAGEWAVWHVSQGREGLHSVLS